MRSLLLSALAILASGGLYYACAQQAEQPPAAIPAQNAPIQTPTPDPTIKTTGGPATISQSPLIKEAPLQSDYVMGDRKAPVVIVEYASLSCPHCAHFSKTVLPVIEKNYIKTGKVVYILRQFPLNEPALRAAMLLDCVGEASEEKYYTFARVLFDAQDRWAFDANFMEGLETIATVGGISRQQFKSCVDNKDREMKVLQAKKQVNDQLKVPHTPYIYINSQVYEDAHTPEAVSKFIESKLAKSAK